MGITALFLYSFLLINCSPFPLFSTAANTFSQGESLADGETLISSDGNFELGFFSPANSSSRYVGIWYTLNSSQSVVWVANRDTPVTGKNGVFKIGEDGNLVLLNGDKVSIFTSNVSISSTNTTAILANTGNLILSSTNNVGDTTNSYWQSFNFPTDTYLPGMRVLVNKTKGETYPFRSWKSITDPSTGNYIMGIDPRGSPQIMIWENSGLNPVRRWRSGQWNGLIFIGVPNMTSNYLYGFKLSTDDGNGNTYFTYTPNNSTHILKFRINPDGYEEQLKWNENQNQWALMQYQPADQCEFYNKCGNFSICNVNNSPICSCFNGFNPKNTVNWNAGNWTEGCVRRTQLQCVGNSSESEKDGFLEVDSVKLPDYSDVIRAMDMEACKERCLGNCSCNAYAYVSGIGCMIWGEDLVDVEQFSDDGKTLFIRLAASELASSSSKLSTLAIAAIVVSATVFLVILLLFLFCFKNQLQAYSNSLRRNNGVSMKNAIKSALDFSTDFSVTACVDGEGKPGNVPELPIYSFQSVSEATDNFSLTNKLGQGGFGPVFKGTFPGGQEIAIKRLSMRSGQGADEFKNEIILIAKLQHRNLVRLIGCCIEDDEKMLIYEYMPNRSLDFFLFDATKQAELDWVKRFAIIEGIARGLLYLHRDSRLRIIHRDLKASNILLDEDMNPKISDFGMARIFAGKQNEEANTNRIVGTYGYMSPEYAMEGLFSVKSDVYSFGVLLLEIISGRKNNSFKTFENLNLIKHAWNLWIEGNATDLIDPTIANSCSRTQVLRCIHVAMLCVQDSANSRPTMSTVVLMLESENATMPIPKQPTITTSVNCSPDHNEEENEGQEIVSSNEITVSAVTAR